MARTSSLAILAAVLVAFSPPTGPAQEAAEILKAAGVTGGLVVHVGCGDGTLTAALRAGEGGLVHGLDTDPANVTRAREHVRSRGLYGPVAIDRFDGRALPYIDNLVTLVVAADPGGIPMDEVMRVLRPGGTALVGGKKTVKPRPADIDDWTHYLYDPSNNAVSKDLQVAPPRHLQWIDGPRYSRHHDHMSGASAMAAAGGRLFSIFDYASPMAVQLPSIWKLAARDAFNGAVLWTRPIETWHTQMFRLKSGPAQLTRRLVAIDDRLYVTLGLEAPVSALDTATGKTLHTFEDSAGTEEILVHDGVLFAMINDKPFRQPSEPKALVYDWPEGPRRVAAYEAASGKSLWSRPQASVLPLTMAADGRRVVFHDGERVVCLDRKSGDPLWRSEPLARRRPLPTSFAPTLVLTPDVVLFSGGGKAGSNAFRPEGNTLHALSLENGKELWNAPHPPSGHRTAQDTLVVGGLAWTPAIAHGSDSGEMIGRDPRTGEIKDKFVPDVETHWFHHRCYRAKATEKYILTSRTGIEFVDPKTHHWDINHWIRGGCLYGIMPANGMVYNPPHPCACYLEAKLYGFHAVAPASPSRAVPRDVPDEGRLEKGPAFGRVPDAPAADGEWPTLRHDPLRSGFTKAAVPADLRPAWQTPLGGRLSAPVAAGGKIFVARIDDHIVHALDAATGKPAWTFETGGRVDSPPTIWKGRVLFGSADGYVYCLRASDGALAWRFRAAPADRRHNSFGQIESVWPVHGSVLVVNDALYCAAGRWRFLDGGLRLLKLDPATGKKLFEAVLDHHDVESKKDLQDYITGLNMPVALADVLLSDGQRLYMKSQRFDMDGRPQDIDVPTRNANEQGGEFRHLFCPTGLLDDVWWHRSYWVFGRVWKSGAGGYFQAGQNAPAGRPLVFDDKNVYGYGRKPQYYRWTTPMEYQLFASDREPEIVRKPPPKPAAGKDTKKKKPKGSSRVEFAWAEDCPVLVRAMVLAGRTIFLAGPPDLVDEEESLKTFGDPDTQAKLADQAAALEGKHGMLLQAVSAADGKKLAEWRLESVPVFDGLIAAGGRLYLTAADGRVHCLAP